MDFRDDPTDSSAADAAEPATSTGQSDEEADEIDGFIFNNSLESDGSNSEPEAERLAEREQKHIVDLVRLQPTKNAELQDQWGLASGSAIHQYLESQLKEYYYRDDDGYIRATDAAEKFAQHHQDVYQDTTDPEDNPEADDAAPDLQRRDLVIALVTLTQDLGHLPSVDEINEHGEYRHQRYQEEFGDLFNAYQAAGIFPDDVTRQDFYGEDDLESKIEDEAEAEEESESVFEPEQKEDALESEPVEVDVMKIDVDRPNFHVPDDFDEGDLIEEIQRFADLIEEPPTEELVEAYGQFPIDAYREAFGSWGNSLEAAGVDLNDLPDWSLRKYTNVEVLDGIRAVANELGRPPMTTEVGDFVDFSAGLGTIRFGSWATALELAGLDTSKRSSADSDHDRESGERTTEGSPQLLSEESQQEQSKPSATETAEEDISKESATSTQSEPSRQELLDEIKRLDKSLDRIPYVSDIDREVSFTAYLYRNWFESWEKALEAAGVADTDTENPDTTNVCVQTASQSAQNGPETNVPNQNKTHSPNEGPTPDELIDELQRLDDETDGYPLTTQVRRRGQYDPEQYYAKFGSWDDVLRAAGIDKGQRLLEEIERVAKIVGDRPTTPDMNEHGAVSATTHANHFGSWTNAVNAAEERGQLMRIIDEPSTVSPDESTSDTTGSSADSASEISTGEESTDLVESLMEDLQEDL